MRILIFSTAYYPFVGGAEVAIKEIADRMPETEFDLVTARYDHALPLEEKVGNVQVFRVGVGVRIIDKLLLASYGGLKGFFLHRKRKYDCVWSMMASYGGMGAWWFSLLARKIPLLVTLQEGDAIGPRKAGLVAIGWRLILSRAALVTVISNYLGEEARRYGYTRDVRLVPNAVDARRFRDAVSAFDREAFRKKLGYESQDMILITTSRLEEKNAVDDIISALALLPESVKLFIAGVGTLKKKLREQVREAHLGNRVQFAGFISNESLPSYLHAADIFIRPSLSEGMGISFLEAMAAGLPVIATRVGGIADFLDDGVTGYECLVRNPESIAVQVTRILGDGKERDQIVARARAMIGERYTWDTIVPRMCSAFEDVSKA